MWKTDISDVTRETIWKYLQLILFTIVGGISSGESFGDTAKLFEAINEGDLKKKLEETVEQMQGIFDTSGINLEDMPNMENFGNMEGMEGMEGLPNPEEIHEHISGLLGGKLGSLAKEIAEETAEEINIEMGDATSVKDVFEKLFKNPGKLMGLVKNVGQKLDHKIKSGEIKESELVKEASEMMNKMKDMPGVGNIGSMLNKMGVPGVGKGKVNMGAFQSHMDKNMKQAVAKERMQKKLEERRLAKERAAAAAAAAAAGGATTENLVFSTGEKVERTPRDSNPKKNKRKNKRRKGKKKN